jgi:energy-coupling factor transporter ATP-binding protein EcfA2
VIDIFKQLHREGSTIIVVTHDPEVAEDAERTVVLEHGRVARIQNKGGLGGLGPPAGDWGQRPRSGVGVAENP